MNSVIAEKYQLSAEDIENIKSAAERAAGDNKSSAAVLWHCIDLAFTKGFKRGCAAKKDIKT